MANGFRIVLSAERILMARYNTLFDGMVAASQTTTTPGFIIKKILAPRAVGNSIRAPRASLGLRRIESALLNAGENPRDVIIVTEENLKHAIGSETRIIGVSSGDPLGLGMNSSTMEGIGGGRIYSAKYFNKLIAGIGRLRGNAPEARVVVGGPGAWQFSQNPEKISATGIDHVVSGYCENSIADIFKNIAAGKPHPEIITAECPGANDIPPIRGATTMGVVEISRGCGFGCGFCTLANVPMSHLPEDTILSDVGTNVGLGQNNISLISEDVFRYGGAGAKVCPERLCDLLSRVREIDGVRLVQFDHANIVSVALYSDEQLAEVRRLMVGDGNRHDYVWLNLGVETADGDLLADCGGRPKMGAGDPTEWGEFCMEQIARLEKAGFFPFISLLFGLPGEKTVHVEGTIRWVECLKGRRVAVFPLFYAPVEASAKPFAIADMTPAHWRLLRMCYRFNFKWIPRLCWDNQTRGGAGLAGRLLIQVFGRMQTLWWKILFAIKSGSLRL